MSLFGKRENSNPSNAGAMPPPPPVGMQPRPPMAPGAAPLGPRPPMAPPAGAPGAPMGPRPMVPGPVANGPAGPRPPMAPGAGFGPKPMVPGPVANGPAGPRPPMAPGAGFGPRPFGAPMSNTPSPSPFGPAMQTPAMGQFNAVPMEAAQVNVDLDSILSQKKNYKLARSAISNGRVSYEQFCSELTFEFFDSMLRTSNLMDKKTEIKRIEKLLVFALTNVKDLPDRPRDILYNAALRFTDFLKAVVYYPEKGIINDEIVTYLPVLKNVAHSFRSFLLKNR